MTYTTDDRERRDRRVLRSQSSSGTTPPMEADAGSVARPRSPRVRLPDGRTGTVVAEFREGGCRCRTVIVRLDTGREWVGERAEVRPA